METKVDIKLPDNQLQAITCTCGAVIKMNSIAAHYKSKKHKIRIGEIKIRTIEQGSFVVKF